MTPEQKIEKLTKALQRAATLAGIAYDWDLGTDRKVQIEDEWVSCAELHSEFKSVLEECAL